MVVAPVLLTLGLGLGTAMLAATPAAAPAAPRAISPSGPHPAVRETRPPVEEDVDTVTVRLENDVLSGSDSNYSSGAALTLTREGRGPLGRIWGWLGAADGRLISSYELGQLIVTPADITRPVPDPADRPYAGLLYLALSTQRVRGHRFDGLKLVAGVVGPASLAAHTQKQIHRWTGSLMPQGWDSQLKNEPILNAVYEHRQRHTLLDSESGWSVEAIPRAGGMLGNVLVQAQVDGQIRLGYNLPDDFGRTLIRGLGNLPFPLPRPGTGSHRFGAYAFASGGANLVARNLTLDGNTFRDGPRVEKIPLFPAGEVGVSVWTSSFEATVSYVFWGREYDTQAKASRFGTATISFRF
ncbi:MAG TPA: lipid A deacylase LpxR family protein [Vicinamibacterales bacterium]|nr:lipid A deacylase LpxR family protein [Vicinamibacterales bacterium]